MKHHLEGEIGEDSWQRLPWLTAGFAALAGFTFYTLVDMPGSADAPIWRQAMAAFVGVATLSLLVTIDRRRPLWSLAFALGWGAVIALIGFSTASYNRVPNMFEWPFLSGLAAVVLAAPLFQAARDEGAARFPPARIHHHVWTDATMGGVALLFTAITFLVCFLIAQLFKLIGIELIEDLLEEGWFAWMLGGFAFGGAIGLMRLRESLLGTVRKLVMVILALLAPVLAVALWTFLLSLPLTGLTKFWNSGVPPTPLLLLGGFGAFALANLLIGDGEEDEARSPVMRWSALALVAVVLPLAILAALSLGQRIGQYGWTPERLWGVVAVGIALAYGALGWWSLFKGRAGFAATLRPLQVRLALGVCALALLLALPLIDFGRISANSQLARLHSNTVAPEEFDWRAMAFDFGPAGRAALADIARSGPPVQRKLARTVLASENRYVVEENIQLEQAEVGLDRRVRLLPTPFALEPALRRALAREGQCLRPCAVYRLDDRLVMVIGKGHDEAPVQATPLVRGDKGEWWRHDERAPPAAANPADPATAPVEVRTVTRRQMFVGGRPAGEPFE